MKHIKVIIVDPTFSGRNNLRKKLEEFSEVIICDEANNFPDGMIKIKELKPDFVILDTQIFKQSSLGFHAFFSPKEVNFEIAFVTHYDENCINAFRLWGFNFLLKPIDSDHLIKILTRFQLKGRLPMTYERINSLENYEIFKKVPTRIALGTMDDTGFVDIELITYMKARKHKTEIFLVDGRKIFSYKQLGEVEDEILKFDSFFRCHRSYIINTRMIRKFDAINKNVAIIYPETRIPFSKGRMEQMKIRITSSNH